MSPKTYNALKKSIKHWRRLAEGKEEREETPLSHWCALCDIFLIRNKCVGCPVNDATEGHSCNHSPWERAVRTYIIWKQLGTPPVPLPLSGAYAEAERMFRDAAKLELQFLEGLLPKENTSDSP